MTTGIALNIVMPSKFFGVHYAMPQMRKVAIVENVEIFLSIIYVHKYIYKVLSLSASQHCNFWG